MFFMQKKLQTFNFTFLKNVSVSFFEAAAPPIFISADQRCSKFDWCSEETNWKQHLLTFCFNVLLFQRISMNAFLFPIKCEIKDWYAKDQTGANHIKPHIISRKKLVSVMIIYQLKTPMQVWQVTTPTIMIWWSKLEFINQQ